MQKDVHFYLTYLLARRADIPRADAETIAWADQYTDDLTEAKLYGIQTQSAILGNWEEGQIQLSVLAAFHFIPGIDTEHPWLTTRNNWRARRLVDKGSKNLLQFGIALHGLQDTFSHENFSGWREDVNSCFEWYYIKSALPNVGHAEMRVVPDVVNYVWTDPRSGKRIDNKKRTMSAAKATWHFLTKYFNPDINAAVWQALQPELQEAFKIECYDDRKKRICELSGEAVDYANVSPKMESKYGNDFIAAARIHLANAMNLFRDLPMSA